MYHFYENVYLSYKLHNFSIYCYNIFMNMPLEPSVCYSGLIHCEPLWIGFRRISSTSTSITSALVVKMGTKLSIFQLAWFLLSLSAKQIRWRLV